MALAPQAQDPNRAFRFWFSTESAMLSPNSTARTNFEEVERHAAALVGRSLGRLTTRFNDDDFIRLEL
jgi:hypothetical protein